MEEQPENSQWVYVAIEDPGGNEQYVGLYDEKTETSYIPAFNSKEEALACMLNLPRRNDRKYEVQAVLFDFLARDARKNGFLIFMLDGDGRILKKIEP